MTMGSSEEFAEGFVAPSLFPPLLAATALPLGEWERRRTPDLATEEAERSLATNRTVSWLGGPSAPAVSVLPPSLEAAAALLLRGLLIDSGEPILAKKLAREPDDRLWLAALLLPPAPLLVAVTAAAVADAGLAAPAALALPPNEKVGADADSGLAAPSVLALLPNEKAGPGLASPSDLPLPPNVKGGGMPTGMGLALPSPLPLLDPLGALAKRTLAVLEGLVPPPLAALAAAAPLPLAAPALFASPWSSKIISMTPTIPPPPLGRIMRI